MRQVTRGFTLIEMLVALAVMALLALMSWRGLDAMLRAQQVTAGHHAALQSLQGGLAQWQMDLDALVETPYVNAVEWDGRVLRVLRRSPPGRSESLQVVAWALGTANTANANAANELPSQLHWLRWQSLSLQSRADLLAAWADAAAWGGRAEAASGAQVVAVAPMAAWQVYYFRSGAWVAADKLLGGIGMGGAGNAASGARPSLGDLPEGLRLQLEMPEENSPGPLQGVLQSDWFNPLAGAAR